MPEGESATAEDLAKLDNIRLLWETYFSEATDGRGQVTTTLDGTPSVCPLPLGDPSYCTDCGPCGVGVGDCDGDSQCESGLSCVNDVGANYGFPANIDVCVEDSPSCSLSPGPHRLLFHARLWSL